MKGAKKFLTFKEFKEAMVAGDSSGDPTKIASGETSGAITNIKPEAKKKKDRNDKH